MIRPFLAALSCLATQALADCGPTPGACSTENGEYHAAPVEADNAPAVIFLHGSGDTGPGVAECARSRRTARVHPREERHRDIARRNAQNCEASP